MRKKNNFVPSSKFQVPSLLSKHATCSMQLAAIPVILFLFLYFPVTGCYSQQNNAIKQEEDEKYTWDFGTAKQGEILKHVFVLKNEGAKTLNITGTHTSCGCTVSQVEKNRLLPQEETEIEVKLDTAKYLGQIKQFVYVNTDSLDNPVIRYIIKVNIEKDLSRP